MGRNDSELERILLAEYAATTRHYACSVSELDKHRAITRRCIGLPRSP
jgi:hypothetical protein